MDFCNSFNLTELIERPIRITETSESLIDVILASNESLVSKTNVFVNSINDHELIVASLNLRNLVRDLRPYPPEVSKT